MQFGQLIEYDMRRIFEKSCINCVTEIIPRLFSKKIKISRISGSIVKSFTQSFLYAKLRTIEIY